jgi:plastocyanin
MDELKKVRVVELGLRIVLATCMLAGAGALGLVFVSHSIAHAATACKGNAVNRTDCTIDANSSLQFSPQIVVVTQGVTVTWVNTAGFNHTTTSDTGDTDTWNQTLTPSGTFSFKFNTIATDGYFCLIHGTPTTGMFGTIKVDSPSAAVVTSFSAVRVGRHTNFHWSVARHSDVAAFNLLFHNKRINHKVIATRANRRTYRFRSSPAVTGKVLLQMVLHNGALVDSGPYRVK